MSLTTTTNPRIKVKFAVPFCWLELMCKLRCVFMEGSSAPAGSNVRETLNPVIPFTAII